MEHHLNSVIIVGRVARDPEAKEVRTGLKLCKFSVAVDHTYKNKEGQYAKETCFIECVVWNKIADSCMAFLKKGSLVTVDGRLKEDTWNDKTTGEKRSKHVIAAENVVFMDPMPKKPDNNQPWSGEDLPF